jgi:hypothetical protein
MRVTHPVVINAIERKANRKARVAMQRAKQALNTKEQRAEQRAALIERDNEIGDRLRAYLK